MPHLPKPKRPAYIPEKPKREGTGDQSFYNSRQWRQVSRLFRQQNPLCENCHNQGLLTPCNVVDHIIPMPAGSQLDQQNLMSLCHKCHNIKSAKEKHTGGPLIPHVAGLPIDKTQIFKILL